MTQKRVDILKIIKILMMVLSVSFMLSACSGEEGEDNDEAMKRAAVSCEAGDNECVKNMAKEQEGVEANKGTCWAALIVSGVYEAIGKASIEMYSKITNGALALMMVAFAVWFSFRMLGHLGSLKEVNPAEFWTEVLRKLLICLFCGILASSQHNLLYFLNLFVFPVYNAMLEFGAEILNAAAKSIDSGTGDSTKIIVCKVTGNAMLNLDSPNPQFPNAPKQMMECLICAVWQKLNYGYEMAFRSMQGTWFMGFFVGILIVASFTFVKIGFAFYLVDTIFKFGMMLVILPLLIMSFAFKGTKQYATKAFFIILNSAAFMMFIAIVVSMTILAMDEVMNSKDVMYSAGASTKELSVTMLCLMMICFLVVASIGVAQSMSSSLVGGDADAQFQKKIAALGKLIGGFITGGASRAIGSALKQIKIVRKASSKISQVKAAANKLRGIEKK